MKLTRFYLIAKNLPGTDVFSVFLFFSLCVHYLIAKTL